MNTHIAIYPGTFDPITLGHQNIIERASLLCDKLYVCVAAGYHKSPLFTLEERTEMVKLVSKQLNIKSCIEVVSYDGLLVDLCRQLNAKQIIRGLRNVSDFQYELQLAAINRSIDKDIETIFLPTNEKYSFISSTIVREIVKFGGKIDSMVDIIVEQYLLEKFANR